MRIILIFPASWQELLHDFLQFDQYDYSFVPPDRRYAGAEFYLPAFNVDEDDRSANDIWVCVDTSSSISEEELSCAMTEILDAMRQARLKERFPFLTVILLNQRHLIQRQI